LFLHCLMAIRQDWFSEILLLKQSRVFRALCVALQSARAFDVAQVLPPPQLTFPSMIS
jgi:hypothetical protein